MARHGRQMPTWRHHWQGCLVLNPSPRMSVAQAKHRFYNIINHFRAERGASGFFQPSTPCLAILTSLQVSERSQDVFFRASFFNFIDLDVAETMLTSTAMETCWVRSWPASRSSCWITLFHTPLVIRIPVLRGASLVRDHHRCVISRNIWSEGGSSSGWYIRAAVAQDDKMMKETRFGDNHWCFVR